MLTELKLANFRIFDDEVTVRFRPITVFIGRNSSGKSTIIKFLLMLQQSLGQRSYDFLSPDGELVSLGRFAELKNSLTLEDSLIFDLSVKHPPRMPASEILTYHPLLKNVPSSALLYKVGATVQYTKCANAGNGHYSLVNEASNQTVFGHDFNIHDGSNFLRFQIDPKFKSLMQQNMEILPELGRVEDLPADRIEKIKPYFSNMMDYIPTMVQTLAEQDLARTLRYQIYSMLYLSPIRYELDGAIQLSSPPVSYIGKDGRHALPHLQRIVDEDEDLYTFLLPHIREVAAIDDIEFKTSTGHVTQAYARNRVTGANVLIGDYGFGVSQSLPVLVQGAITPRHSILMVEQPEAQLHPTAQLELGSFFADLWKQRQVASIIETHSRNILLRLRRLIAKGELSPDDVSVAFFTVDPEKGKMPMVKNLDINEDGSMEAGLPMEFFGADIMEGLKIGARA